MNKADLNLMIKSMGEVIRRERDERDRLLTEQRNLIDRLESKVLVAEARFEAMMEKFRADMTTLANHPALDSDRLTHLQ